VPPGSPYDFSLPKEDGIKHLDTVALAPVFDPPSEPAVFEITEQLALNPPVKLSAKVPGFEST